MIALSLKERVLYHRIHPVKLAHDLATARFVITFANHNLLRVDQTRKTTPAIATGPQMDNR
jgi:hypothetical protein